MTETEKLLRAALFALNSIPNNGLKHHDFKDSYSLAKAIDAHLKTAEPGPELPPHDGKAQSHD